MSQGHRHTLDLLSSAAPDATFLTDLRRAQSWRYDALRRGAGHLAAMLLQQGVAPGDRVVLLTRNDPVFFPLLFACAMTGSILVPLNRDNLPAEIEAICHDAEPKLLLHDASGPAPCPGSQPIAWRTDAAPVVPARVPDPGEPLLIIYTSGTTGEPKGVLLTQQNVTAMADRFVDFYHLRPGQRFLGMLPFYHINAPMITGLVCVAAQAHVHLADLYGFGNARQIFAMVAANRINVLSLTPSIMASLVQLNPRGTSDDISSLEFCFCGTAPLGESAWRQFEQLFGVPVYQGYGLTETTTWATMTPPDNRKRYDTVGLPVGCDIHIEGEPVGEVLIKGDIVMPGYYHRKKLTHKVLQDGWYRSGDVGCLDADGQLVIVGRIKNIIKRRGELIHPELIDSFVLRHGLAAEACTIGVPDAMAGERVVTACVSPTGPLETLRAALADGLSGYMRPDEIVTLHAIPRNPLGKPLAARVRDIVSGEAADRAVHVISRAKVSRAPSEDLPAIRQMMQQALEAGTAVTFSGFWGIGRRDCTAEPDRQAIGRLADLRDEMNAALGEARVGMLLLLADMHGRCNRVPDRIASSYLDAITDLAEENGLATRRQSAVWQDGGLCESAIAASADDAALRASWDGFPLREEFLSQAVNRCGNPDRAEEFAYRYYRTCLLERPVMTQALQGTIFFTYNAPKFRAVLPELPMVYWHSIKPGTTAKPWFM